MLNEMLKESLKKVKGLKMGELESPKEEYFPLLSLDSKALAEIEDWEVGEDYYLVIKVTQKSKSQRGKDDEGGENLITHCDFDIKEIGVINSEDKEESSEEDSEETKDYIMKKYDR